MRRRIVAVLWISGATVPLLMATVFILGCCVLPFHGVVHKLMPLCHTAAQMIAGDDEDGGQPAVPARPREEPAKRIVTVVTQTFQLAVMNVSQQLAKTSPASAHRSFISLGAIRCDQDVGLHVLIETFLI